ncbi:NADPH-dependent oxidoreductase [Streptococcus pneumoniae]|uniref:NAD(P)H-dependent oxidoreductase n=1 Tax=Streptococcus pneumoniae TaxID=1313 RepID=UPI0040698C73
MKFVGLVGSNYDQSYNRKLLEFIRRYFKLKFELEVLEIDEVPMFNQDEKWDESFQLRYLYNKITRADGVIIATPEHNHTISASLKSVLEWLSYEVHPFELTYADDNNQFLYYNNAHQDPDTMFAKRVPPQSGSRMSTVHGSLPPARMKNVEWVIGTLRNGNQEYVRTIVPGSPAGVINTHNYQAMYYPDGSYAGINEIVFNFQPWLDWYLKETGQRLVGGSGPFAPAAGGHGDADATSGASDSGDAGGHGGDADATAGASY